MQPNQSASPPPPHTPGLPKGEKKVRNANRNQRSRGRFLLHGQDMGKTQDHRSSTEQWLAVGGGWRLVVSDWRRLAVGGLRLAVGGERLVVGGGWRLAVGGWRLVVCGWWRLAVGGERLVAVGG